MDIKYGLTPAYASDLRAIVSAAFDSVAVTNRPLPSGCLLGRMKSPEAKGGFPVKCEKLKAIRPWPSTAIDVPLPRFLELQLPHRVLALGPLLDIALIELELRERVRAEAAILRTSAAFDFVPLSRPLLTLLRFTKRSRSGARVAKWWEDVRRQILAAPDLGAALTCRAEFRMEALTAGATGLWPERSVCVSEFFCDILVLCKATCLDIDAARVRSSDFSGSVSLALSKMDEDGEICFEQALPALVRPAISIDDFADPDRDLILQFIENREALWIDGLLPRKDEPDEENRRLVKTETLYQNPFDRAPVNRAPDKPPEKPAEAYRRLKDSLSKDLLARPELTNQLALIGMTHLLGIRQSPILLCGPTGVGKTFAVQTIARSLEADSFLQVNSTDLSPPPWQGTSLADLLDGLSFHHGRCGPVVLLDELDKIAHRVEGLTGNSLEANLDLQSNLLAFCDGQPVTPTTGTDQVDSKRILIFGSGAFGGQFTDVPPDTADLVKWGFIPELAVRWGTRIVLTPPTRSEAVAILRNSERSIPRRLGPLAEGLGVKFSASEAALEYVAHLWLESGSDVRSASEWLLASVRRRLIESLENDHLEDIVITPDDIEAPRRERGGGRRNFGR